MEDIKLALKKKHPIGIPAFPVAAIVDISIHVNIVGVDIVIP